MLCTADLKWVEGSFCALYILRILSGLRALLVLCTADPKWGEGSFGALYYGS